MIVSAASALLLVSLNATTPRIAVVDFDSNQYSAVVAGAQLADYVVDELVNSGAFEVVEREKLNAAMTELGLGASGMVDMESAARMGRLLGARLLMTGRVISLGSEEKSFSGYGIQSRNTVLSLAVSARIVDVQSGSVVFSTRTTAQRTIQEGSGLSVRSNDAFNGLAEEAAVKVVAEVVTSGKFSPSSGRATEPAPVSTVEVNLTSSPEGADVEADGIFYGNANGRVRLPEGLRLVRVSLAGYEPWEKKVMVVRGLEIHVQLTPMAERVR